MRCVGWPQPPAHGVPVGRGVIRRSADDFFVQELPNWAPTDAGEHEVLWIEKRDANTQWVARALARAASCRVGDVGYAGLKDRRAVTRQWFSVPVRDGVDWPSLEIEGVRVLAVHRHQRKLRTGALAGNRFRIRVSELRLDGGALEERLDAIRRCGVPNYFGPQRFGRDGGNVELARRFAAGERLDRRRRGFALSAARAVVFNAVLAERVRRGDWAQVGAGDVAMLAGSNSFFVVADDAAATAAAPRAAALDLHPSGPLWGDGESPARGDTGAREAAVAARFPELVAAIARGRVDAARRPLRIAVEALTAELADGALVLGFELPRGSFATAVLNEVVAVVEALP